MIANPVKRLAATRAAAGGRDTNTASPPYRYRMTGRKLRSAYSQGIAQVDVRGVR